MEFIDKEILSILEQCPSECAYLDYKEIPYSKNKKHDFVKDIIAMLNSEEGMGRDKAIIFGVAGKEKFYKGIDIEELPDDSVYQQWSSLIIPKPYLQSGYVEFEGKYFGYIFLGKNNTSRIYEVGETSIAEGTNKVTEKNAAFKGQAFSRRGSSNYILMQDDRANILKAIQQPQALIDFNTFFNDVSLESSIKPILAAVIVGSWNEDYKGDISVVEAIYGGQYEKFIVAIRKLYGKNPEYFKYKNKCWKVISRFELIKTFAREIFDDHIEELVVQSIKIFDDIDPKYELSSEQRFAAGIYGNRKCFSNNITTAIAEFLAIIGNNYKLFISCSSGIIQRQIRKIIESVFNSDNWRKYASLADCFQFIAESYPEAFLNELERGILEEQDSLIKYLTEKEIGITTTQYGYQLGWILSTLAAYPKFFSKACVVLFSLAKINMVFLDNLVGIILPWYPQTLAPVDSRVGIVKGFFNEDSDLAWELLIRLLPQKTTHGMPVQKAKYIEEILIPEETTTKDYWYVTKEYLAIACKYAIGYQERLTQLIEFLDDMPKNEYRELLNAFLDSIKLFDIQEKEAIWNKLKDFMVRHRKYNEAKWALPEEALIMIEEVCLEYFPNSREVEARRLFQEKQYDLSVNNNDWEQDAKDLFQKQTEVVNKLYVSGGLNKVLEFADSVYRAEIVGHGLAYQELTLAEQKDIYLLASCNSIKKKQLAEGYSRAKFQIDSEKVIENVSNMLHDLEISHLFAVLPMSMEIIQRVAVLQEKARKYYWCNVAIWGGEICQLNIEEIVNNLLEVNRGADAIEILSHFCVFKKLNCDYKLVSKALDYYASVKHEKSVEYYNLQGLVGWLQENCTDDQILFNIEWKYLNILDSLDEGKATTLQKCLSENPEFFIEVLSKAFKGRSEKARDLSNEERRVAEHCHKLLYSWKRIPGIINKNEIDNTKLKQWLVKVIELSKAADRFEVAMTYFGHTLCYAPADGDGFFINRSIAEILQSDKEGNIRSGYATEVYNSRGIHNVDKTGSEEFDLERKYLEKAEQAEGSGYFRLAETLRSIAKSYHNDAIHNIEEWEQWEDNFTEE